MGEHIKVIIHRLTGKGLWFTILIIAIILFIFGFNKPVNFTTPKTLLFILMVALIALTIYHFKKR